MTNPAVDLSVVRSGVARTEDGIPFAKELVALTEALHSKNTSEIDRARQDAAAGLGAEALVDAVAVAAHFDAITRVADATGIELDAGLEAASKEVRAELELDDFYTN